MDSIHTCLAVISFDSALKKNENYHPQVFLKQYKYIKINIVYTDITQDIKSFSNNSDKE